MTSVGIVLVLFFYKIFIYLAVLYYPKESMIMGSSGKVEGAALVTIGQVGICPMCQQQVAYFPAAGARGKHERRRSGVSGGIYYRSAVNEDGRHIIEPHGCGMVQGGVAAPVRGVQVGLVGPCGIVGKGSAAPQGSAGAARRRRGYVVGAYFFIRVAGHVGMAFAQVGNVQPWDEEFVARAIWDGAIGVDELNDVCQPVA